MSAAAISDEPQRETLATLSGLSCWVAWQSELRKPTDRKTTKVPYAPAGPDSRKARANDHTTWGTRQQAEERAARLPKLFGLGGVGIELAGIDDGRNVGGIDLDDCRDPETGELDDWAQAVIDRLASYTEISPSGSGVKVFFLYATSAEMLLRGSLGTTADGKPKYSAVWKRANDGNPDHPKAIEVHLGNRYFAVTDQILDCSTDELREVPAADILAVIQVDGPAFVGNGEAIRLPTAGKPKSGASELHPSAEMQSEPLVRQHQRSTGNDQSRSAAAFRVAAASRRRGVTYEAMCEELRTHELTAEWFTDKGQANGGRELRRLWEKTDLATGDLILAPSAPMVSARTYVAREHTDGDQRTLHHQNATFYTWRRSHYAERSGEEMRSRLYEFLEHAKRYDEDGFLVAFDPNKTKVTNVQEAVAAVTQLATDTRAPSWLDGRTDPVAGDLIACTNGLLHLPTMALHKLTPAFFSLNALDFAYNPEAGAAKEWLAFLATVWPNDQESINTLQELFGLLLTADTRFQKAFLIVGPKRSGKGTIARVLTQLLGAANVCGPTLSALGTNFGIAPLIGKRLALISDARLSGKADQSVITERLLSVTGEDGQTVDRKFRDAWFGKLDARFVILTNEMPKLSDSSGALAGRFIVLRMTQSFYGKEDLGLGARLEPELPAILLWAIEGWRRLKARKHFITPASAKAAQEELENLASPIGAFLREVCEVKQGCSIPCDELYAAWCDWCREQGRDHPGTAQTFGRDLSAAAPGVQSKSKMERGNRFREYEGIRRQQEPPRHSDELAARITRTYTRETPLCPYYDGDPGYEPVH